MREKCHKKRRIWEESRVATEHKKPAYEQITGRLLQAIKLVFFADEADGEEGDTEEAQEYEAQGGHVSVGEVCPIVEIYREKRFV